MHKTLSEEDDLLLNVSNVIWKSLEKVGHLTKWCALFCESMDMELQTKLLYESLNSLQNTRNCIAKALDGIETNLKNELNGEEGEERERERRA